MKKRNFMTILSFLLTLSVLTGCGSSSTENIDLAFESIEALDYDKALEYISKARENSEDEKIVSRAEGIAYLGSCRYEEAIAAFINSLSKTNGLVTDMDFDVNYYLASAYYKNGNYDEALSVYDSILALKPNSVDALYLSGLIRAKREELDTARANFDKAISLEPENYEMLLSIYGILEENGYAETGRSYLLEAMENSTKKMTNFEKGRISYYLEDYESARTYLEKAKDEEGDEAVLFLGKTYETLGDVNYAVSVYSSYVSSGNSSTKVLNQMGLGKMSLGDYEGALLAFQQAMKIEDNDMLQTLRFNEIVAYEYMGEYEEAKNLIENYIRSYPDDENAKREYIFLKSR